MYVNGHSRGVGALPLVPIAVGAAVGPYVGEAAYRKYKSDYSWLSWNTLQQYLGLEKPPELGRPAIPTTPAQFKPPVAPRTEAEMRPGSLFTPDDMIRLRKEEVLEQLASITGSAPRTVDGAGGGSDWPLYLALAAGGIGLVLLTR